MKRTLVIALLAAGYSVAGDLGPRTYEERCIQLYASKYGVQATLIRAIIDVESGWQPGAVSSKGAIGLMQLMPATARRFDVQHPFWIHENIRGGVVYLRSLLEEFHGDLRLVVAAYYAGPCRIRARRLAYADRRVFEYVRAVAARYREELGRRAE